MFTPWRSPSATNQVLVGVAGELVDTHSPVHHFLTDFPVISAQINTCTQVLASGQLYVEPKLKEAPTHLIILAYKENKRPHLRIIGLGTGESLNKCQFLPVSSLSLSKGGDSPVFSRGPVLQAFCINVNVNVSSSSQNHLVTFLEVLE